MPLELPQTGSGWVSSFDLITQLAAWMQDAMNWPVAHFGVTSEISRRDLRQLLKRNGIHAWGLMLSPADLRLDFAVKKDQAKRTRQVLEQSKVAIVYCPPAAASQQERRQGWIDGMFG